MMTKVAFQRGALVLLGLVVACSSSGSGAPDQGAVHDAGGAGNVGTTSCAGSPFTWKDDGVAQCATSVVASGLHGNTPGNTDDTVEIVGTQGLSIGISILVASPPRWAEPTAASPDRRAWSSSRTETRRPATPQ